MFDLGQIDGIPLCFTDGAALPDGTMVFTAVAEGGGDNYNDGACAGAAVGIVGNELQCLYRLDWPHKVEGVNARVEGNVAGSPDPPGSTLSALRRHVLAK